MTYTLINITHKFKKSFFFLREISSVPPVYPILLPIIRSYTFMNKCCLLPTTKNNDESAINTSEDN